MHLHHDQTRLSVLYMIIAPIINVNNESFFVLSCISFNVTDLRTDSNTMKLTYSSAIWPISVEILLKLVGCLDR